MCATRESQNKRNHWLLLLAAHGLANANAKFQSQSQQLILNICLARLASVPQLFYLFNNKKLILVIAKIVDDLLMAYEPSEAWHFISAFDAKFKLGVVVHRPRILNFFAMTIEKIDDYSILIHAVAKVSAIEFFLLLR